MSVEGTDDNSIHDIDLSKVVADSLSSLDYQGAEESEAGSSGNQNKQTEVQDNGDKSDDRHQNELGAENTVDDVLGEPNCTELAEKQEKGLEGQQKEPKHTDSGFASEEAANDDGELDLSSAISSAISTALTREQGNVSGRDEDTKDAGSSLEQGIVNVFHDVVVGTKEKHSTEDIEAGEENDDINLEEVIGKAFDNAMYQSTSNEEGDGNKNSIESGNLATDKYEKGIEEGNEHASRPTSVVEETDNEIGLHEFSHEDPNVASSNYERVTESSNEHDGGHEDLDLSKAIGIAFGNILSESSNQDENNGSAAHDGKTDDISLERAIDDAFNETTSKSTESNSNGLSGKFENGNNDSDLNLDEAIGNAFNDVFAKNQIEPENNEKRQNSSDQSLNEATDNTYYAVMYDSSQETNNKSINGANTDNDDEINLVEAIGNAFKSIMPKSSEPTINTNEQSKFDEQVDHNDLDLENAIDNAFKSITNDSSQQLEEQKEEHNLTTTITKTSNEQKGSLSESKYERSAEKHEDDDLNAVISASFKQLINNAKLPESQPPKSMDSNSKDDDKDFSMEIAISEAFRLALDRPKPELSSEKSEESKASQKKPEELQVDLSNIVQNIVNQMSSSEEDSSNINHENLPISEDVLQELALEITNQVQDQLVDDQTAKKHKTITDMPQIDDNVLAHFQNEAYKDENDSNELKNLSSKFSDDNSLQAALANVVRNAIESNATTLSESNNNRTYSYSNNKTNDQNEADLEQLQMNEILQNAFNMAMENPHDLLSNLEIEDYDDRKPISTDDQARQSNESMVKAFSKLSHPLPASTTTFLESLNRSNDIDLTTPGNKKKKQAQNKIAKEFSAVSTSQTDRIAAVAKNIMNNLTSKKDDSKGRTLTIAETLALHRSSMMNGPKRDYSSIESLEETLRADQTSHSHSLPISSQLSKVLSSLSSRINTTIPGTENNVLQVIRQMTNALTSTTQASSYIFPNNASSVSDIISSYKGKDDEKDILNSLILAKKFLEEKQLGSHSNGKAVSLIDNVLSLFNSNSTSEIDPTIIGSSYNNDLPYVKPEFISSISNSVISAISNFTSRAARSSYLLGEKPRTDSPQYKERIRLENRERKKKWREENAERNKDNDLRSRVLKRANTMFGEGDSPEKKTWIDEEFNRRKEKRIAKQKKDEQERQNKGFLDDNNLNEKKKARDDEPNSLTHDPNLIKPVTDIFNILSGTTHKEDPQAALVATSAATATAAAIYAANNSATDLKQIDSAVSSILSSLMDNAHSTGQQERIASLSRGVVSSFKVSTTTSTSNKQPSLPSKLPDPELSSLVKTNPGSTNGILNRLSATIKGLSPLSSSTSFPSSLLNLQTLNIDNKRKSSDALSHDSKRQRSVSPSQSQTGDRTPLVEDNEKDSISKIASNLDQIRNSITANSSSHLWGSTNALKMPHYKKPESSATASTFTSINSSATSNDRIVETKKEHPTLLLSNVSPFISHKVSFGVGSNNKNNNSSPSTTVPGLRKPGSFQRPSYSRSDRSKAKSLGFPPLYSSSFRPN